MAVPSGSGAMKNPDLAHGGLALATAVRCPPAASACGPQLAASRTRSFKDIEHMKDLGLVWGYDPNTTYDINQGGQIAPGMEESTAEYAFLLSRTTGR